MVRVSFKTFVEIHFKHFQLLESFRYLGSESHVAAELPNFSILTVTAVMYPRNSDCLPYECFCGAFCF